MRATTPTDRRFRPDFLITAIVVTSALYFGRQVFIPIAAAFLLSFLASPLVERLERRGLGRLPAVLCAVGFGLVAIIGFSLLLARQVYDIAYRLPEYKDNIVARAEYLQGDADGILARVTSTVDEIHARLAAGRHGHVSEDSIPAVRKSEDGSSVEVGGIVSTGVTDGRHDGALVPVEIARPVAFDKIASTFFGGLIGPLGSLTSVIVLVIFMLLKREDLRNRFISLVGGRSLNVTTQAMDDAARRISSYLVMQTLVNSIYGLIVFVGLAAIGVPNSLLWGSLAAILRFVPFIGPFIAATIPLAISLAAFAGWTQPCLVVVLYVANEALSSMVIEPWLFGSSTGLSAIGMLVAAAFWTWLWGPVGMILATPLTVCLSVMGRYVPQLESLNTLLGEGDTLPPEARYYQRLLANDPEEAVEITEEFLAEHSLDLLYDRVLIPALTLAERDWRQGGVDDDKRKLVLNTTRDIVEELGERERQNSKTETERGVPFLSGTVLCLSASSEADEIAGIMLSQLLEQRGICAEVASSKMLSGEIVERIEKAYSPLVVCVSSLRSTRTTYARYLCKRLRRRIESLRVTVGMWQLVAASKKVQDRFHTSGCDRLFVSLSDAAGELEIVAKQVAANSIAEKTGTMDERRCA